MLTAAYTGDSTITIAEAEPQAPEPGQVQIRVAYVGLCGTDLHILHGNMDARVQTPARLRPRDERHHRGGRRRGRRLGRRRRRDRDAAGLGRHLPGVPRGQPAHLPEPRLHRHRLPRRTAGAAGTCPPRPSCALPDGIALDAAALVEPVAVAVHDVRRSELAAGDKAVVIGGGPIGVLIATVARAFGAEVAVIELDPSRRAQIAETRLRHPRPARDRPGRLGRGLDRRRRRRRRLRGVRRGRRRARRHGAGEGARHHRGRRHPPDAARDRPAAGVLARTAPPRRPRLPAHRLRAAVELVADGVIPSRRADHRDRAAGRDPRRLRRPRGRPGDEGARRCAGRARETD